MTSTKKCQCGAEVITHDRKCAHAGKADLRRYASISPKEMKNNNMWIMYFIVFRIAVLSTTLHSNIQLI